MMMSPIEGEQGRGERESGGNVTPLRKRFWEDRQTARWHPYIGKSIDECRQNDGIRKSLFGNHTVIINSAKKYQ